MKVPRSAWAHRSRTTALVEEERPGRVAKSRAKVPLASPMFSSAAYVLPSQKGWVAQICVCKAGCGMRVGAQCQRECAQEPV